MIFYLFLLPVLVILSGYFSGTETSLFSLSKLKIENIIQKHPVRGKIIEKLLNNPQNLLITILSCNILVNILIPTILEETLKISGINFLSKYSYIISLIGSTIAILIFGEVTPKSVAIKIAPAFSLFTSPIIYMISIILTPAVFVFKKISNGLVKLNSLLFYTNVHEPTTYNSDAVIDVIKESKNYGIIDEEEGNILHNLIQFPESDLFKIIKPRSEIFSIPINTKIEEVITSIKEKKYSRIPIWENEEENIIGILHAKDLLKVTDKNKELSAYRTILKKTFFVPDSIKSEQLLKKLQATKNRIAIVIDEYGGISGLVTIEDILEEIIGEVVDKDDIVPLYYFYGPNIIEIEAKMEISEFNKVFNTNISCEDAASVGGYILYKIKRIPKPGEIFIFEKMKFKISGASPNKIESIMVTKVKEKTKKKKKSKINK